ncbi:MAG: DNA mismatch repair protein [Oscillospiraceae bacterium]|nr:DNA mismatch repair protein [Oscillospiraceae bacterium]
MKENKQISILFPFYEGIKYKQLSELACHDLGIDTLCRELTNDNNEQNLIMSVISNMTSDTHVALYRQKVFVDILNLPDLRKQMLELFDKIEFIRNFSTSHIDSDEKLGFWHLIHRLDELDDYISCVEAMRECLSDAKIKSEGLLNVKKYIDDLYEDSCFGEMKKDIAELKARSSNIQSVTLGINVNERFEAVSMGLISVNNKPFKKSSIVSNFADAISSKNKLHDGTEWDGDMHYHHIDKYNSEKLSPLETAGRYMTLKNAPFADKNIRATVFNIPDGDGATNSTFYLDTVLNKMLDSLIKKLRDTLNKYADIAIVNISQIMPEFMYYIRFAEFISRNIERGFKFCEAQLIDSENVSMDAKDIYNLKLAMNLQSADELIYNDLKFDTEHTIYILTGANRGGKTTITQAVGLMFILAQGGIFVPASSFEYKPVDCIYTHFPADEDKTMDLGRLGEECVRFKAIYSECTKDSLLLLNETFSTTSFEEGFYIAKDSVRALLKKQVKTIYNTHMHKLAADVDEMNMKNSGVKVSSLIMKSDNGKRSFKLEIASPEGLSYAKDIAEKYGVTYEMLTN